MNKKNIVIVVVFFVLSVVVTYGVAMADALRRNSLFGEGGVPLRFTSGTTFLGEPSTNYLLLFFDIIFWFIILLVIWKFIFKK